ncbi:MAG: hypothetical protein OXF73_02345 [Gammaproteobacteria bacterium]|nr:hypothetical protein [Gammaproteobacteria bacterium]
MRELTLAGTGSTIRKEWLSIGDLRDAENALITNFTLNNTKEDFEHFFFIKCDNDLFEDLKSRPAFEKNLQETINKIYENNCKENWDNGGAKAITSVCKDTALLIVGLLPHNISEPDITPTPHGEIDFDWINDDREMLTLSICQEGSLAWSAQYDKFTCQGDSPWERELPCPLICCLQNFCKK